MPAAQSRGDPPPASRWRNEASTPGNTARPQHGSLRRPHGRPTPWRRWHPSPRRPGPSRGQSDTAPPSTAAAAQPHRLIRLQASHKPPTDRRQSWRQALPPARAPAPRCGAATPLPARNAGPSRRWRRRQMPLAATPGSWRHAAEARWHEMRSGMAAKPAAQHPEPQRSPPTHRRQLSAPHR